VCRGETGQSIDGSRGQQSGSGQSDVYSPAAASAFPSEVVWWSSTRLKELKRLGNTIHPGLEVIAVAADAMLT